ncbi:MAG: SusC/RagA family TonB-linked outer membrane protein, partial [Sphingobacteriales bacterium]
PVGGMNDRQNPVRLLEYNKDNGYKYLRLFGNAYADLEIIKNLHVKTSFGIDYGYYNKRTLQRSYVSGYLQNDQNSVTIDQSLSDKWTWTNTALYNFEVGKNHINLLAGTEMYSDTFDNTTLRKNDFLLETPDYMYPDAGTGESFTSGTSTRYKLLSYFGKAEYDYDNRYLFSATIRRDGSSRFGQNNRFGTFPAVSAGWRISDETFLKSSELISDLKLRASYGLTGNFKIPNYGALGSLSYYAYVFGATPAATNGAAPSSQPNPDLSWEKTAQVNFGVDGALFQNNLTFSFDYYNSNTTDLLLNVPVPLSTGFSTELVNIGKVNNRGFEINLGTQQKFGGLIWGASANFSTNKNKVIELGPGNADIINTGSVANAYFITRVGQPIGSYFLPMQDGVFKTQAEVNAYPHFEDAASNYGLASTKPGDFKFIDADGDKLIDLTKDRVIIGSYQPKFTYGFSTDFQFRGFDLDASMQGVQGNKILNLGRRYFYNHEGNMNNYADAANRWKSEADPGSGVNVRANRVGKGQNGITSSWHIEDGSYLRIRNITFGYSFGGNMLQRTGLTRARVYVTAQNPFLLTNYQGYNPEVSNRTATTTNGEDYGVYPTAKTFSAGINLTF